MDLFAKKFTFYKKIMYVASFFSFMVILIRNGGMDALTIICMVSLVLSFLLEYLIDISKSINLMSTKHINVLLFIQLVFFKYMESLLIDEKYSLGCIFSLSLVVAFEFLVNEYDYDRSDKFLKYFLVSAAFAICIIKSFMDIEDMEKWELFVCLQVCWILALFFFSTCCSRIFDKLEKEKLDLILDISEVEDKNQKLVEYHEKVKTINEMINFQKINLNKVVTELEQANKEIESQTELMRYMASTFNTNKCMNFIAESIINIKKPKICAIYVDRQVYMNKFPGIVIKTNYTSMESRLNKDIEKIFKAFESIVHEPVVYKRDEIKEFRFIGDANINSLMFMPIDIDDRLNGIMIVGSDNEDFFDKGLNYYESCIMEFKTSLKSIKLYLQMQDMARKDGLTGLYNRLYFKELFSETVKKINAENSHLSVALFDIDKFKNVNDTYGHLAGDEVIKMVASKGALYAEKYNGFACRYGGEEFLLVLPDKDEQEALEVLEKMHNDIKANVVEYGDLHINVNVSIGLSSYPNLCDNPELLVSRADKAMYYSKEHGRGRLILDNSSLD